MNALNSKTFKAFLDERDLPYDIREFDEDTVFHVRQKLDVGPTVTILFVFRNNDDYVNVLLNEYIDNISEDKNNILLETINELNKFYSFIKFTADNGSIRAQYGVVIENDFKPTIILSMLSSTLSVLEEEYPKLMKKIWA